jgi:hypothetical protein
MEDGYVEIGCSIFMKGVMLPGHGNVLEVLGMGSNINVLICLLFLAVRRGTLSLTTWQCAYPGINAVR